MDSSFSEAEIQALIAVLELTYPKETPNNNFYKFYPKTLDEAGRYFRRFRVDWTAAFDSLLAQGLLVRDGDVVRLSETGRAQAEQIRSARPPIWYWYEEFYLEAPRSPTYSRYCEMLYGKALCQANFSDMTQLDGLLQVTNMGQENHVLDLGCGPGLIAQYISDMTGAHVTGMDYSPTAIRQAQKLAASKRDRLAFCLGNLDKLPFPPQSFDTLIAIDTLYMPNDLDSTLAQMRAVLSPGGKMAIFYSQMIWDPLGNRETLRADRTPLGQALGKARLRYQTWDFSAETYAHMQRKRQIAETLRSDFAAEGRLFLYDHIVNESEKNPAPFDLETNTMSRYLYLVQG